MQASTLFLSLAVAAGIVSMLFSIWGWSQYRRRYLDTRRRLHAAMLGLSTHYRPDQFLPAIRVQHLLIVLHNEDDKAIDWKTMSDNHLIWYNFMSDDIDKLQEQEENGVLERARRQASRRVVEETVATGECLFCEAPLPPGLRWCGPECRDDWQKFQDLS